jgi:hypothetical protein
MKRAWNMIRKELLIYLIAATALVTWGIIWYYHKQLNKDTDNEVSTANLKYHSGGRSLRV